MSSRRVVILVASIFVALIAGVGLLTFANNNSGSGSGGGGDETAQTVLVADGQISEETFGQNVAESLKEVSLPASQIPAGAITDPAQIEGRIANSDIFTGQVILGQMFVEPRSKSSQETAATLLRDSQNALISINVNEKSGVSGLIEPGDYVNLYVKRRAEVSDTAATAGTPTVLAATVDDDTLAGLGGGYPIYQKVRVAAVGRDVGPTPGQVDGEVGVGITDVAQVVTLEVSAEAAQFIATYDTPQEDFWFHLALVGPDYEPVEPLAFDDVYVAPENLIAYEEDLAQIDQEG